MLYQSRENAEFSDNKDKLALQRKSSGNLWSFEYQNLIIKFFTGKCLNV